MSKPQVLRVKEVTRFERLWSDNGCGKNIRDGCFYRPLPVEGFYSLGDIARPYHAEQPALSGERPVYAVAEKDPLFPHFLRKPIDYQLVWNTAGTRCKRPASIWMPIPPPGYVALGCVVSKGSPTDPTQLFLGSTYTFFQIIANLLSTLSAALPQAEEFVWRDKGSGGNYDVSVYDILPAEQDKENAVLAGCIMAVGHYGTPTAAAYALDKRCIIPSSETSSSSTALSQGAQDDLVQCPKCQGHGSWGVFGGCDASSVHVVCAKCPMCMGKRYMSRGTALLCSTCDGLGGLSPAFGKCDITSLHFQPCQCMGTGLAAGI